MGDQAGFRFKCPGCGAGFGWKPQYAGRKIRCKCGQVFMPPDPAAVAAVDVSEPDPYALSDDATPPPPAATVAARRPQPVNQVISPPAAAVSHSARPADPSVLPASVTALYPRRTRQVVQEEAAEVEGSPLKDLYVPLALLALGLGLRVAQLLVANNNRSNKWGGDVNTPDDAKRAVLLAVFQMVIASGVMIAGAVLAATILNLNLGSIGKAGLKLCSIAVFAAGVASWVAIFDRDRHSITGLMVALHIVVITYWIGLVYLFSLELQETLLAVSIISLLHAASTCALWKA